MNRCTEAIVDIHGIKWYYPEICVDGGIYRAKNTYTNLTFPSGSFKHTNNSVVSYNQMPYSGHFYGIRKYTGLAPELPYFVEIAGKTGSSAAIGIPSEILEVEYNKNDNYGSTNDYSGFRLASNLYASGEFGKSIASQGDLLAIGCPKMPVTSGDRIYDEAGKVFLYRRNPRPTTTDWPLDNYKSDWTLEKELTLPSGFLGDYSVEEDILIAGLPQEFVGTKTSWFVGQNGRQFGHSIDLSVNSGIKSLGENKQEILVVGGVGAKWDRTFDDDQPTPVSVGLMIFTDEFSLDTNTGYYIRMPTRDNPYRIITYENILQHISGKDLIFNYFANPRVKFDVKIMLCIMTANSDEADPEFPDKPSFITLNRISKNAGYPLSESTINNTVSGITSAFLEAFPYTNAVNSGIPPILGLCFDGSFGAGGREALEPAIDKFIDFYKAYSLSGVKDFYNVPSVGSIVEYSTEQDINWIEMSKSALNEILDTGNLVQNNQVRFFASNVGTFNKYDKDFNILPDSGGKVYIFEKESGNWNLIQEIRSPNVTREYHDRFGHAVSISEDGEVLVIGSPYISEAVTIYERNYETRDYFYNYALINWMQNNRAEKYKKQLTEYFAKPVPSLDDRKSLYLSLDQEDKFKARLESNIEEYQKIYTFDQNSMQPIGSWSFVASEYAPTSRIGYSVDVNEDGSIVVAGAPTDSLNLYNDSDVYYAYNASYKGKYYGTGYIDPSGLIGGPVNSAWSSSLYAGSAHVFESRRYYPHNKAIEYGAFGNLHENISNNTADSGHFGHLSGIFSDKNFEKTPFDSNFEIPKDVGLAFIITPAEARLNDEIYDNILEWLAFGDRNLVLVGNDPIWEASGQYSKSNEIINAILTRLQSRMRIVPARNRYESLPEGYSSFNNIIPSFVPQGSTSTFTQRSPTRGSGVADIKIYSPGYYEQMFCEEVDDCSPEQTTIQIQSRCEMPLMHYGDLRAQWNASCCTNGGLLVYGYNWPFLFGSYKPACGDTEFPDNPLANFEPIPLLVAAERTTQEIVYPAIPETSGVETLYDTINTGYNQYYEFGSQTSDISNFSYSEESLEGTDYNSISYNVNGLTDTELFYKPKDLLGGVLQAKAVPKIDNVPYISKEIISDKTYFCLEYSFKQQETSKIIIIPSLKMESQLKAGSNDENILFYQNLVSSSKTIFGRSSIAQLNWNGSDSFVQSYDKSLLRDALLAYNGVTQNVSYLDSSYNVAWFPNVTSEISEENINNLTQWLSSGSKKFILTYDGGDQSSVKTVISLCGRLGIKLELLNTYDGTNVISNVSFLSINQDHQIGGNYFTNTKLKRNISYFSSSDMIVYPLKLNTGATALAYVDQPIYDDVPKEYVNNTWDLNPGVVKINVPVLPGSGYKFFVTIDSLDPYEAEDLTIDIDNVSVAPTGSDSYPEIGSMAIYELDKNRELTSKNIDSSFPSLPCGGTCSKEFQVGDTDNINIYISCTKPRLKNDNRPKSKRLIGISGVLIPIYDKVSISTVQVPIGVRYYKRTEAVEESREIIEVIRPISTDNSKYCKYKCEFLGNQLIEDGPMVAAQEQEILSSFQAGFKRSRITVITDSSILQGRYVLDDNGTIPQDTYNFIRSLYPETDFFSSKYGRQFNVYNKLISPERGSPNKYHSKAPSLGLNKNFGNFINTPSDPININESNYIPKHITRPKLPWEDETDEKKIKEIKDHFLTHFASKQSSHSCLSKISGVIDGVSYSDASVAGGVPKILKEKGYDYLDLDRFPSGYLGDLFGYSVSVRGKNILVGSPFSAFRSETAAPWSNNVSLSLANDGGAGSAYMFEKSVNNKWENVRKFKPESLMGQLSGVNVYSDHFGYSLNMHNDVIIIGAPSHSYSNYYNMVYNTGPFSRKNFNPQFDIPQRITYDLGNSGIRNSLQLNYAYQKNIGAIYLYENKITDWENKKQSWELVEKIISTYSRPSGEKFGKNIYLSRPYRSDSDYSIFAGCNFASGAISNVGVAYAKDIMIRSQRPSTPNSGAWISAKVFGYRDIYGSPTLSLNFSNSGDSILYYASGVIITNNKGEIFLEVSGQDPSTKGFISHRPYIKSIYGYYQYGKLLDDGMPLFIESKHIPPSSNMPLYINVQNSANVYNTLGLYNEVKDGSAITSPSGLYLFAQCSSGNTNGYLTLYSSGNGYQNDSLNLQVRGY
jgi:hypothetical protein